MNAQNLEFFPLGESPTYKNTWIHTLVGISYLALAVILFKLSSPYLMSFKTSRNTFVKGNLERINHLISAK